MVERGQIALASQRKQGPLEQRALFVLTPQLLLIGDDRRLLLIDERPRLEQLGLQPRHQLHELRDVQRLSIGGRIASLLHASKMASALKVTRLDKFCFRLALLHDASASVA